MKRPRQLAAVGLLALGLAGCSIPPSLYGIVNDGAATHAAEHVAANEPGERVLCADQRVAPGYLVPSFMVVKYAGCPGAIAHATATTCDGVNPCQVLGDAGTTPILQLLIVDRPCVTPDGFPFLYTGPVEALPPICGGDALVRCEEDQPCWDCTTMGNRVCGPQ